MCWAQHYLSFICYFYMTCGTLWQNSHISNYSRQLHIVHWCVYVLGHSTCADLYLVCLMNLLVLENTWLILYFLYELDIHVKYCLCKLCGLVVLWPWLDVILVLVSFYVVKVDLGYEWPNMIYRHFLGEQ